MDEDRTIKMEDENNYRDYKERDRGSRDDRKRSRSRSRDRRRRSS